MTKESSLPEEKLTLSGRIEKIVYKAPESGFVIFSLQPTSRESFTVQGTAPDLTAGEVVTLYGSWKTHPKWGRQFYLDSYDKELPRDAGGIEKYLGSGVIKGIGPSFAKKLVDYFGAETLEIIDKYPQKLAQVPGVGAKRIEAIIQGWEDQREVARVMVFLRGKDISPHFASKIYKLHGNESIERLTENPYRLVEELWGVGFKTADTLAMKLGLEKHSIHRVKAAISHALHDAMSSGHMALPEAELFEQVNTLLGFDEQEKELISQAIIQLQTEEKIFPLSKNDEKFWARAQCYHTELRIAKLINKLCAQAAKPVGDVSSIYNSLRTDTSDGISLNEKQLNGICGVLENKVSIITGGPGTGKTTLVKKLLSVLKEQNLVIRLAAPTGRAAKRMFESTGYSTETIHRLLEFTPGGMSFSRNQQNTIPLDVLVVDEASMIDSFLFLGLVRALPSHARLVLLGDVDQLPSVGPGNILHDLIDSGAVHVTRLTEIFRQAQDSMIVVNAHKINRGEFPSARGEKQDFFVLKKTPEECLVALSQIYRKKLPQLGISSDDAVVLVPMNRGLVGTQRINATLQNVLNPKHPDKKEVSRYGTVYRSGDRVMQIRNNYTKFVFNGDLGVIKEIDTTAQKMIITFGERDLEYDFYEISELILAYAISIHKSQGSEFRAVIVPVAMQHFVLLQKNLIYTAVTRAKQLCILMGEPRAIGMALRNTKESKRHTFLRHYLENQEPFTVDIDTFFGEGLDLDTLS